MFLRLTVMLRKGWILLVMTLADGKGCFLVSVSGEFA